MKKILKAAGIALLGLMLLTGCDMLAPTSPEGTGGEGNEPTPLEVVIEKYSHLGEAKVIEREIEIVRGALTQYESRKHYEKSGETYTVSGTERTLNGLDAESAYTEKTVSETLPAGTFEVRLNLSSVYFQDYEIKDGTLEAVVWNGNAEAVFGIRDLSAPVYDLTLTVVTDENHVTKIGTTYGTSNNSLVTVSLTFTY